MNRQQKETVITDVRQLMNEAQATFLVNYQGLSVASLQSLRRDLRKNGGNFKVAKATLMRIASNDIVGSDSFSSFFKDQVGLIFVEKEISGVAKQLFAFAKQKEALKIVAGFYQSKLLNHRDILLLASLPSREVLLAQLAATMQAPMATFVRLLQLLIARLVFVLKRIEEKQLQN